MKRKLQVLLRLVCTAVLFSSCASSDTQKENVTPEEDEGRKVNERQGNLDVLNPIAYSDVSGIKLEPGSYISIIGKSSDSEFWNEVEAGAERAAEDLNAALGYKGEDKIKVNYSGSAKGENIEEQINILDEELARNPVAVGIAIIDSSACEVQFDLAAENGIPIVAFDSGSDYKNIQAMCSANNSEIGKTGAAKLASIVDDAGDVALFVHDKESTSAKQREAGFLQEMQGSHPNVKVPLVYHLDDLEEISKTIAAEKNKNKKEGRKGYSSRRNHTDRSDSVCIEEKSEYQRLFFNKCYGK